jgi:hypothetical protein
MFPVLFVGGCAVIDQQLTNADMVFPHRMSCGFDGSTDMRGSLYDALQSSSYHRHHRHQQSYQVRGM